jgi:hypothetical protein
MFSVVLRTTLQRDSGDGQERGPDGRRPDHHGQLPASGQRQVSVPPAVGASNGTTAIGKKRPLVK